MHIFLRLPSHTKESRKDFMALTRLFPPECFENAAAGPQLNANAANDSKLSTRRFEISVLCDMWDKALNKAELAIRTIDSPPFTLDHFLKDAPLPDPQAMPIKDAADALARHVVRIDHIGINVPRSLPASAWKKATGALSHHNNLYEYPNGVDGYDPAKNLWLFLVQNAFGHEGAHTKFELAHDGLQDHSVVQIDIKTDLSPEKARALFPTGQQLPGLEDYFLSVPVSTQIPGMQDVRLDVRFAHEKKFPNSSINKERTAWENGSFFTEHAKAVMADKSARLPRFDA